MGRGPGSAAVPSAIARTSTNAAGAVAESASKNCVLGFRPETKSTSRPAKAQLPYNPVAAADGQLSSIIQASLKISEIVMSCNRISVNTALTVHCPGQAADMVRGMLCRLNRLGIRFSGATIFHDFSLEIDRGACCGLSGNSGSGKTTLLQLLAGTAPPNVAVEGTYQVDGRVGYVPQEGLNSLSPFLTVGKQVADLAGSRRVAENLLEKVGLGESRFYEAYPHWLSGGERQRVLIAQALALSPDLIVADEPTANLDAERESQILALLRKHASETGAAILIASHRQRVFAQLTDRVVCLTPGEHRKPSAPLPFPGTLNVVSVQHLRRHYTRPAVRVLEDVCLQIKLGECVAITGASGAGKSTLARCLAGREIPDAGSVSIAGPVQLVQQEPSESLNPKTTIRRAIAEACAARDISLERIGLPQTWLNREITSLSEGQRARVAILRTGESLEQGGLLILDESLSGLDDGTRSGIAEYLTILRRERGLAILFVTHDEDAACEMGSRVLRLQEGRVQ